MEKARSKFVTNYLMWTVTLGIFVLILFTMFTPIVNAYSIAVLNIGISKCYIESNAQNIFALAKYGALTPFAIFYGLVFVSLIFTILGKFVKSEFYDLSLLIILCAGVFFVASDVFYNLSVAISIAHDPNTIEKVAAISEAKLGFGAIFAGILCFVNAIFCFVLANKEQRINVKDIVEIAVFCALAIGLQFIKVPIGATGGSINLGLIPLFFVALRHGPTKGFIASAFVFGLITCLTDGYGLNTYPFDYLIGFGGVSVLGFFSHLCFPKEKTWTVFGFIYIAIGVILASEIRFIGATISSGVNYGYSLKAAVEYNSIYVFVTGGVSLIAMELLYYPLAKINKQFPVKN